MKQKYTKPVLIKETFTLSQSIAKNCGRLLNFAHATMADRANCGWDVDGNHNTTAPTPSLSEMPPTNIPTR